MRRSIPLLLFMAKRPTSSSIELIGRATSDADEEPRFKRCTFVSTMHRQRRRSRTASTCWARRTSRRPRHLHDSWWRAPGPVTGDLFQAKWAAISDQDERTLRVGPRDAGRRSGRRDARLVTCAHDGVGRGRGGAQVLRLRAGRARGAVPGPGRHLHGVVETQLTVKTEGAGDAEFFAGIVEEGLLACR